MIYGFNADEIFQIAIDIEENGKRFYERAVDIVDRPELKALLASLAREEAEHRKRFAELKAHLPASATSKTVWDPDHEMNRYLQVMADMSIFRSDADMKKVLSGVKGPADVLLLGIQAEKDSIVFYLAMQDAIEEQKGREHISQVVEEEKRHLKELSLQLRELATRRQ